MIWGISWGLLIVIGVLSLSVGCIVAGLILTFRKSMEASE